MADPTRETPETYPPLGRMLMWVDVPGNPLKLVYALAGLCVLLFLADFTYEKHSHFKAEYIFGFYAIYGFVMFTGLILLARALRMIIKRPEDYYGDKAIDREDYPADQLDKGDHDA